MLVSVGWFDENKLYYNSLLPLRSCDVYCLRANACKRTTDFKRRNAAG